MKSKAIQLHQSPMAIWLCGLMAVLLLLLTPLAAFAQENPPQGPSDPVEIETFVDGVMAATMDTYHVPGTIVVIVKDGEVLFTKGYGLADRAANTPVDPAATLFRPGSVSKLFTWTAVMQLVEQGKIDLDADVNTYLDFEIPTAFDSPITMTHLMTHTPGFEDVGQELFVIDAADLFPNETFVKEHIPARVFKPGTIGAYSNYGTALAGYIIERVSGVPFEAYIEENILTPLGMTHATFRQPLPAALAGDMSGGYNFLNGEWVQGPFEIVTGSPAGALSASGLDMAKFMIAHLQDGEYNGARILDEETAQLMHSPLYTADPRLDGIAHGFFYSTVNGQSVLSHGGDTALFHSELMLLPEDNLGVFISTNGAQGHELVSVFKRAMFDHYYPVVEGIDLQPLASTIERAQLYTGSYTNARSNYTRIERILNLLGTNSVSVTEDGKVVMSALGMQIVLVEIEPGVLVDVEHPDQTFVLKEVDGQVQLHPSMPFVLIKNRWFESNLFHQFLLLGGTVILLAAVIAWSVWFFIRRKHDLDKPDTALRLSRWAAALFLLIFLAILVGFFTIMGDMEPATQMPYVFFGSTPAFNTLLRIPILLLVLAVVMAALSVWRWVKHSGTLGGRIFYSLLVVWAAGMVWSLHFWNFLLF